MSVLYVVKARVRAGAAYRKQHPGVEFVFNPGDVIRDFDQLIVKGCGSNRDEAKEKLQEWLKAGAVRVADPSTLAFVKKVDPIKAPAELSVNPERTLGHKAPEHTTGGRGNEDMLAHHNDPNHPLGYDPAMLKGLSEDALRERLQAAMPELDGISEMPRSQMMDILSYDHRDGASGGKEAGESFVPKIGAKGAPKT